MPGVALPPEFQNSAAPGSTGPGETALPPVVAASLALHGCAEIAITLRRWWPDRRAFACFALAGELAASLSGEGDEVELGLFGLGSVIPEVVRLVPAEPPPVEDDDGAGIELSVVAAGAVTPGWQQTLVGGARRWRRVRYRPAPAAAWLEPVGNVGPELAAELRFALADCVATVG
jgi:hypothetical protein